MARGKSHLWGCGKSLVEIFSSFCPGKPLGCPQGWVKASQKVMGCCPFLLPAGKGREGEHEVRHGSETMVGKEDAGRKIYSSSLQVAPEEPQ